MANKLQELRAKLLEKEKTQSSFTSDNAVFPFWNIPEGTTAVIRFLPDLNENNDFFWAERQMVRLSFPGVAGQNTNKEVIVQVPCVEMWGETCPILTEIRPWFKDTQLEDLARKYWKKRSYVFQGFVRENPLKDKEGEDAPENPIRRLIINPSIFDIIKAALMDPEMEEIPTDYNAGTDFRLIRTKQGEFSSYKTSSYSRKNSSLTPEELAAIEAHGLFNLSNFLPKKPGDKELQAITEMFEASVNGELYDPNKWAEFYKPAGLDWNSNNTSSNVDVTSKLTPVSQTNNTTDDEDESYTPESSSDEVKVQQSKPSSEGNGKKNPKDILAEIKARAVAQR